MEGRVELSRSLTEDEVGEVLAKAFAGVPVSGRRVLVLIPDDTRHAPIPMLYRLLNEIVGKQAKRLDFLIALGTHPPMPPAAVDRLVGIPESERGRNVSVVSHCWDQPDSLVRIGVIQSGEIEELTGGLLTEPIPLDVNRLLVEYDQLVICGPVFPHEVAGFSGGAKYIFPGVAGQAVISATHWLGALGSSMKTIGVKDTAVRRVIHRAAELVPRPIMCLALAVRDDALHAIYAGGYVEAWDKAADVSAQLEITYVAHGFQRVLSIPSTIYHDLWTAAKAMYKTEPAIADGGEVIIYAPALTEISYTHGRLIDEIGYHVLEYFTKQPERFASVPGVIKAHSTHVKGWGSYNARTGSERPRIQVTLATGIPQERCERVNLGYLDPKSIDLSDWTEREAEGVAVIRNAGEILYRAKDVL